MSLSKRLTLAISIVVAGLTLSGCALMRGSDYPTSDITWIVPFAPGGTTDPISRTIAQELETILKTKIVVVNKPGASATLGTSEIVQAKPDGYTIGLSSNSAVGVQPHVLKLPYAGPDTYQPLVRLTEQPEIISVRADAPWKTFQEFLEDARKNPGKLRVATVGKLTTEDMCLRQFGGLAKVNITSVPFSGGGGEALTALLGGHVEASTNKVGTIAPQVAAGKARVLAVLTGKRTPVFPDVPTVQEMGYNVTAPGAMFFAMGPKGLDKAVIDKLVSAITQAVKTETFQKFARETGLTAEPVGPEETAKQIKKDYDAYASILKEFPDEVKK